MHKTIKSKCKICDKKKVIEDILYHLILTSNINKHDVTNNPIKIIKYARVK